MTSNARRTLHLLYHNLAISCILLVGLELAGQGLFFLWKGYPLYESDQHLIASANQQLFELHPFLVGRLRAGEHLSQNGHTVTATPQHTRWTGAAPGDSSTFRIAVVGGSTTFGAGVTDSASWPARLQAMLGSRYAVTNYGMPGFSSAESVIQTALLVPEGRPDLVVFYMGWNDLHQFHDSAIGPDYFSHGLRQYSNLDIRRPQPPGLFAKLVEVSAICRLAMAAGNWVAAHRPAPSPSREKFTGPPRSDPDTLVERIYRRNLGTLRTLAEASGAYALFVPQVLDTSRLHGSASNWWTPGVSPSAVPTLIRQLNGILAGTCGASDRRCGVLDAVQARQWTPDEFIDEGHFSDAGNDAFARLVAGWVGDAEAKGVLRRPGPAAP